jgi:hypothetical protein
VYSSTDQTKLRRQQRLLYAMEEHTLNHWNYILRTNIHELRWLATNDNDGVFGSHTASYEQAKMTAYQEIVGSSLVVVLGRYSCFGLIVSILCEFVMHARVHCSRITLLTAKISRMLARADAIRAHKRRPLLHSLLVSVLSDDQSVRTHTHYLGSLLNVQNNVVCQSQASVEQAMGLLASPERAGVSIVQADVVVRLLVAALQRQQELDAVHGRTHGPCDIGYEASSCGMDDVFVLLKLVLICFVWILRYFEESIAALLAYSAVTYIEVSMIYRFAGHDTM